MWKQIASTGAILLFMCQTAHSIELKGDTAVGYDSNPFRLRDGLSPDGGAFVDIGLRAKHVFENNFGLTGVLKNRSYESSLDNGDAVYMDLGAQYKKRSALWGKKVHFLAGGGYDYKDKTYVRRSTGEKATFNGQNIEDRYDYYSWKANALGSVRLKKGLHTELEVNYRSRDYENYHIEGLSDLDYDQVILINEWRYTQNENSKFKLALRIGRRDFDNKREKDKNGDDIAGTDLEYDYYGAKFSHRYKLNPDFNVKWEAEYEERRDNSSSGYYDTDEWNVGVGFRYRIGNDWHLIADASYIDRSYSDRLAPVDEDDIESPDKNGYAFEVQIERNLGDFYELATKAYFGASYDDYDSHESSYVYDRYQAFVGIKVQFDN